MSVTIELTEDEAMAVAILLENSGNSVLAVKVRDQVQEQREEDEE